MSSEHHNHVQAPGSKRHKVEGPFNHYLTYILSILLTMLAFAGVVYGDLNKTFLFIFLVVLAVIQALFQVYVWMHAKDRGHVFPLIALGFGGIIAVTAFAAAIYWMWW